MIEEEDAPFDDDESVSLELMSDWTLDAARGAEELLADAEMVRNIDVAVDALRPNRAFAIRRAFGLVPSRYGEEQTLQDLGKEMKLSRERVRQIVLAGAYEIRHTSELRKLFIDYWIPTPKVREYPPTTKSQSPSFDVSRFIPPSRCAAGCRPSLASIAAALLETPTSSMAPCERCGARTPFAHPYAASSPTKRYLAIIYAASTCDRSIGCGIATIGLRGTNWAEAEKEFREGFLGLNKVSAVEDGYKNAFIYEFTDAREINIRELVARILKG